MNRCHLCQQEELIVNCDQLCITCVTAQRDRLEGSLFMSLQMFTNKTSDEARQFIDELKNLKPE